MMFRRDHHKNEFHDCKQELYLDDDQKTNTYINNEIIFKIVIK